MTYDHPDIKKLNKLMLNGDDSNGKGGGRFRDCFFLSSQVPSNPVGTICLSLVGIPTKTLLKN